MTRSRLVRRLAPVLTLLLSLSIVRSVPARTNATPQDWQADLELLVQEIETVHPDPWFHTKRGDVIGAVEELRTRLPGMTWEQSYAGFHKVLAMLEDGHTRIQPHRNSQLDLHRIPVRYYLFPEGMYVTSVHPDYGQILGGRVVRVGDAAARDAVETMGELVPADNRYTRRDRVTRYLTHAELLAGAGITKDVGNCSVVVEKDGREVKAVLQAQAGYDDSGWLSVTSDTPTPLYLQHPGDNYFYQYLPEAKTVYLHFRRVENEDEETFAKFCERTFQFIEDNDVAKLIVDLRLNGGGNNYLNKPLIHGIIRSDKVNREGNLFVIVGRRTFSAAMCGTVDLERQTEALFAGEPTGASPNHHGDAVPVTLPNTGIVVSISALYWQNSDPRDARPWLTPDIPVELTWDDYRNGRDPVVEAVLAYTGGKRTPIAEAMTAWLTESQGEVESAIARYRQLKQSDEAAHYDFGEGQLNNLGYQLMGDNRLADAIRIFELNAEMFPHAYNTWDSLGEAYANDGRVRDAIEAYRRSVDLNPANRNGQAILRRLQRGDDRAGG